MPQRIFVVAIALIAWAGAAHAQQPASPAPASEHDVTDLAKQTQNPVSDLISVPLQFNFFTGGGLEDQTFFNLNVQPVIPFKLNDDWKVIARTIVPFNSYPGADATRFTGIGDIQVEMFISPRGEHATTIGVGPLFSLPTATASPATTGSWGGGLAAVVVRHAGPFVLGGLVTRTWTMQDTGDDRKVDTFLFQPIVNYNFGAGWALAYVPSITADFTAADGEQWTVPVGLGISRTIVFNKRPMQLGFQYYANVERPSSGPGQQIRFVWSLLYPGGH